MSKALNPTNKHSTHTLVSPRRVVHRTFDSGEVAPNWHARGLPGYLEGTEVIGGSASRDTSLALPTLVLQANPLQRILSKCLKPRH